MRDTLANRQRSAPPGAGYWCECLAHTPDHARTFWLGSAPAGSPAPALRWLLARARDVAEQLDPAYALPVRHWLGDEGEHRRILTALARGELYSFTAADDTARYVLSARPGAAW
ncbi:hypothetical protein [Peterkaempfera sp. SMS 1(5)a]|uniref:hypothetical protein n=1 Tax=Peterkaempfera podocarpi TaxID=3232308 RepID=UPI003671EC9D